MVRISTISIALGLSLMIISIAIVIGFKHSVSNKITGFASHIRLVLFDNNMGMQGNPLAVSPELLNSLNANADISYYQRVAHKAGVIKTHDQILGVILKGVGTDYNFSFLNESIKRGEIPTFSDTNRTYDVLVSESIASKLELEIGDPLRMWFIEDGETTARGRKFIISGIYASGVEEIDNLYVIGDIKHIQHLNNWEDDQIGSMELMVSDDQRIPDISFDLYNSIPYNIRAVSVFEEYPQIFNWLQLLDMNVVVILTLLIIVSTITMISTLLILIIERTSMVGLLKALGATNKSIRRIFLIKASRIILIGMVWGNIAGIGFYFLQKYTQVIKLSAESYYVSYVPVELQVTDVLLLNLGTFVISFLVLIIPTWYITRVEPARALRYE